MNKNFNGFNQTLPLYTNEVQYFATITGFGICTGVNFTWARRFNRMLLNGKFTAGTTTAVEARLSLPGSYICDSNLITSIQKVGQWAASSGGVNDTGILVEPSAGYLTFAYGGLAKQNGNLFPNNVVISFFAEVPISGWAVST